MISRTQSSTTATSGFGFGIGEVTPRSHKGFERTGTVKLKIASSLRPSDELESIFYPAHERDYTIVEVPVNHPIWGTSDQYATALGCLPVALGPMIVCFGFLVWGLANMIQPLVEGAFTWDKTGDVIVGIFLISLSSLGLTGIVFRWKMGVHMLSIGYNVFIISQAVSLVTKWLEWGLALGGVTTEEHAKWIPGASDITYMVLFTCGVFGLLVVSMVFVIGWLKSLKMILTAGGSGWERLNYIELLEGNDKFRNEGGEQLISPDNDHSRLQSNDLDLTFDPHVPRP